MKDKSIEMEVNLRETGKGSSRSLRKNKLIPAVVYGPKVKNMNFSVNEQFLNRYLPSKFENTIFILKSKDKNLDKLKVLKKDVSFHPLTHRAIHADFYAIDLTQSVRVNVDVHFVGKPKGVTESGGIFQEVRRNIEVECLPEEIPEHFEIDVSHLNLHESIHVNDIKIPENIKVVTSSKLTLATVVEPVEEKEPEPTVDPLKEDAAAAEGATPEKGEEEKKEEPGTSGDKKGDSGAQDKK